MNVLRISLKFSCKSPRNLDPEEFMNIKETGLQRELLQELLRERRLFVDVDVSLLASDRRTSNPEKYRWSPLRFRDWNTTLELPRILRADNGIFSSRLGNSSMHLSPKRISTRYSPSGLRPRRDEMFRRNRRRLRDGKKFPLDEAEKRFQKQTQSFRKGSSDYENLITFLIIKLI